MLRLASVFTRNMRPATQLAKAQRSARLAHVARVFSTSAQAESVLNPSSGTYIDQMHELWKKDPSSVHGSWNAYFSNLQSGQSPATAYQPPPTLGGSGQQPGLATV
eukprot:TRINITY_DN1651_c0_g2_i1.p3 TRINITY_DN1651_c0_g2~~TRINITY_DN1651_c0_g2_i1.p3  ORF type:complete len:106 (+),score=19.83 TRINITY_DN1651_c0_g2_i1:134-451(+)